MSLRQSLLLHLLFSFEMSSCALVRDFAIDLTDLGKGPGKTIAEDGRVVTKEGVRQVENSLRW
jgi:hypothetical protein